MGSSNKIDVSETERKGQPPDGGWGWLVVAGGLYCLAMWGGSVRCYSVFYAPMMNEFNVDYGTVSWLNGMFQIAYGIATCLAPIVMKTVGRRKLSMVASLICGTSAFLASFGRQLWQVQVLLGLVVGAALGNITITFFTVITRYFKKRLHTANQLLCLGVSAGPLLLCPGYQYLISIYGWRGACQIISGLFLNMAVASSLMRPIKLDSDSESLCDNDSQVDDLKKLEESTKSTVKPRKNRDLDTLGVDIAGSQSLGIYTPTLRRKKLDKNANAGSVSLLNDSHICLSKADVDDELFIETGAPRPLTPVSIKQRPCVWLKAACIEYDFVLFADPLFYLFTFTWVGFAVAFFSAFTYFIPYGEKEIGLSKIEASTLVSGFAAGEMFSRIAYALSFDHMPQRFRLRYVGVLYGAFSFVMLLLPSVRGYVGCMACSVLIGALGGGTDGLFSTFIVEIFDVQRYAAVYGYSNIITHSIGTAATVLIGVSVDRFGSLAVPFYIGCCTSACSSALAFLLHKVSSNRRKRLNEQSPDETKKSPE